MFQKSAGGTRDRCTHPARGLRPHRPGSLNEIGIPHEEYLELRQTAPVHWVEQEPEARAGMESGTGFFAVTRHADVSAVSKNSKDFSTAENGAIIRFKADMLREMVEFQRVMLINQDPPEHTLHPRRSSRAASPRARSAPSTRR